VAAAGLAYGTVQTLGARSVILDPVVYPVAKSANRLNPSKDQSMNRIVYIVGAVVIIIALLSFFGLR
jgi:hypothetical protein